MKWEKLGRIFNPLEFKLPLGCHSYAQSPQTLVCDDFVRIYFSTRSTDSSGKFLSQIAFVDMSKDLKEVLRISEKEVIPLGELGCFDEHGIFPINILQHEDKIMAYTCGWNRRVSVSVDTAVGLAMSHDGGETFSKVGLGPVLGPSLKEPFLVGDGFVRYFNGQFHMWYIFGTKWMKYSSDSPPDRTYKIGHATSKDGHSWKKEEAIQIVEDVLGPQESQALPTVIQIKDRYHMFFCFRESFNFRAEAGRGYRIGHAWSADLKKWTRDDSIVPLAGSSDEWDSDMQCYPHVFTMNERIYLLYNGNQFGKEGFGAAVLV